MAEEIAGDLNFAGSNLNPNKRDKGVYAANTLSVAIKDQNTLYAVYMKFVRPEAGLFIPTKKSFSPGDKLTLLLSLLDIPEKFEVGAKVIWVTPVGVHGARPPGVGLQLEGPGAKELNTKIKQILNLSLNSTRPTYTM